MGETQTTMEGFVFRNEGVAFRDEKLYEFSERSVTVMRLWPAPQAWSKTAGKPYWRNVRAVVDISLEEPREALQQARAECAQDHFDYLNGQLYLPGFPRPYEIVRYDACRRTLDAYERAVRAIPPEVRTAIAPFPERHFSLLALCARCPGGLDLLRSTPALALMLANNWVFRPPVSQPLRSARALLRKTQRAQLAWLGYPDTSTAALRMLRKIPAESCTVEMLLYLRDAVAKGPQRATLRHLPRINRGLVRLLDDAIFPLTTEKLRREVCQATDEDGIPKTGRLLRQIARICIRPGRPLPTPIASRAQLTQRYGWVRQALEMGILDDTTSLEFDPPPIPGDGVFEPIESVAALFREGAEQHHCVGQYALAIAQGDGYAYRGRVGSERITLYLSRGVNRRDCAQGALWHLLELRGPSNAPVSEWTQAVVARWLGQYAQVAAPIDVSYLDEAIPF